MAINLDFVEYVIENIKDSGDVRYKQMFGGITIYCNEKVVALICDDKLFVKPTNAGREFIGTVTEGSAYLGAKPSFLIEDKLEDSEWLTKLIKLTANELPLPKPKKKENKDVKKERSENVKTYKR